MVGHTVFTDLDLVTATQSSLLDALPIDVSAVERARIAHGEAALRQREEDRVLARDRDIVQEDIRARMASHGRLGGIEQKTSTGGRALLY